MAQHILMYIEGKGKGNENKNKILYYADGTIEVRSPQWVLLETKQLGHEITMLNMEDQFNVIYEDDTPKAKAKMLKKKAKEQAKLEGDLKKLQALEAAENEAEEDDPFLEEDPEASADVDQTDAADSPLDGLSRRNEEFEPEAEDFEEEELSA